MSQLKDDTKRNKEKSLRPYKEPQLVVYGPLRDLTAGGTQGTGEMGGGPGGGMGGGMGGGPGNPTKRP
jgi:hypothetical protein